MGIGTASHAQAIKPVPPTPIDIKKVELGGTPWNPQWDQNIENALPPEMLSSQVPRGVRRFCPRFYEMGTADKRTFWAYFFQALAGAEAGLNPNTSARHSQPDRALAVRSEGLLQLSYADRNRYGCDFNWAMDRTLKANDPAKTILQPKNNLECGVKILFNQIIVQHKPLLSRSGAHDQLGGDRNLTTLVGVDQLPTQKDQQRRSKMSDQENRNPQHSDPQKSEPKPGNQPNQPVQQKQENPSGQPKSPQSEQEKHDQEKKKQA
jgi:hypothetical protein